MTIYGLKELFVEISTNYRNATTQPFTNHPLAILIRKKSKEIITPTLSGEDLIVKGSAGMGNWTPTPWIAVFNKNETDGAQEGVYVVYLFSEDMQRVYLTLNQGVTRPIENDGIKIALQKLRARAVEIRTNFPLNEFNLDDNIKIARSGLGSHYEKATIFYKEYNLNNLPENQTLENDRKKIIAYYNNYLLDSNVLTSGTNFQDFVGKVEEGKRILKQHYVRERNPKIIKEAKKLALARNNELKCEVCGFSFFDHYGGRGKDFIEGHHKKPISERQSGEKTSPGDIALVCSNCHKMIHLKMPWLSIEELKRIYH